MGKEEVQQFIEFYNEKLPLAESKEQLEDLNKQFRDATNMGIDEARRFVKYGQEFGSAGGAGDLTRQTVQGLTFGGADELAGIFKGLNPLDELGFREGYEVGQQESLAGVEQMRREHPYQSFAAETAGSMLPTFFTGGSLGILRAPAWLKGASRAKRAAAFGASSVPGAATYGFLDPEATGAETRLGGAAKAGGWGFGFGTGLGASPVGTWIGKTLRNTEGSLLRDTPARPFSWLPEDIPGTIAGHNIPEAIPGVPGGGQRIPVQLPLRKAWEPRLVHGTIGEELTQRLSAASGRSKVDEYLPGVDIGGKHVRVDTEGLPQTKVIPGIGKGQSPYTEDLSLAAAIERAKVQRGLLENQRDIVAKEVYGAMDEIYDNPGWSLSAEDLATHYRFRDLDKIPSLSTAQTDVQKGLSKLRSLLSDIDDAGPSRRYLINVPTDETVTALGGGTTVTGTVTRTTQELSDAIKKGKDPLKPTQVARRDYLLGSTDPKTFDEVGEVISEGVAPKFDRISTQENPVFVAAGINNIRLGQNPTLKQMQAWEKQLTNAAETDNFAKGVLNELQTAMKLLYPGLNQADDHFRKASSAIDYYRVGLGEIDHVGTMDFKTRFGNIRDFGINEPGGGYNINTVVEGIRADASTADEGNMLVANFLDGVWEKEVMRELRTGKEQGEKVAKETRDFMMSQEGKAWLRHFFPENEKGKQLYENSLREIKNSTDAIRWRNTVRNIKNIILGAFVFRAAGGLFDFGGGEGNVDDSRRTF